MNIEIKKGMDNIDFETVTTMLAATYWSPNISKNEVIVSAKNSTLVIGLFLNERQIGYARVVSDKTRFAYILDVIVDEQYRKNGYGGMLIENILNAIELKDVYQWLLITQDAHEFYRKFGFEKTARPNDLLELRSKRPTDRQDYPL